jgi:hypothetical protein
MHSREECKHGTVVQQCRCPDRNKTVITVDCPPNCPKKDDMSVLTEVCEHGTMIRRSADYRGPEDATKILSDCPPLCKFNVDQEVKLTVVLTLVPKSGYEVFRTSTGDLWFRRSGRVKGEAWDATSAHPFDLLEELRGVVGSQDSLYQVDSADLVYDVKTIKLSAMEDPREIDEDGGAETAGAT